MSESQSAISSFFIKPGDPNYVDPTTQIIKKRERKPLILNFFEQGVVTSQPSGTWTYPGDITPNYKKLSYWIDLAKKAEAAKLNAIFIADVLGSYDIYKGPNNYKTGLKAGVQHPGIAPETIVSALAAATKSLAFGITFSSISEHPYLLARRLGSLDHFSDGRVGWNIVSSYLPSAARNLLDGEELPDKAVRYEKTDEYVQIITELSLSSFRKDAVKVDKKTKTYVDPELVREINFKGKHFKNVPGPGYVEPSPQGLPVLFEAGTSRGGVELASKVAEVTFVNGSSPELLKAKIDAIQKVSVEKYKRSPDSLKVISLVMVIVGKTHEEALAKFDDIANHADPEGALALIGGWTGIDVNQYGDDVDLLQVENPVHREIFKHFTRAIDNGTPINKEKLSRFVSVKGSTDLILGSVQEVVDELERWVDISGVDGFNFAPATTPGTFDDLVEYVIPELRKRGLAWEDYPVPGGTLRENLYGVKGESYLPKGHPLHPYIWEDGTKEEFEEKLNKHKEYLKEIQGDAYNF